MSHTLTDANVQLLLRGIDVKNRTLIIIDPVDDDMLSKISLGLQILGTDSPLTIKLATNGGDVESGLGIYDLLSKHREMIRIDITGACHSMGAIILQAAGYRTITANGTLMMHWGYQGVEDTSQDNFHAKLKYNKRLDDICNNIIWRVLHEKNPSWTVDQVEKKCKIDWYTDPQEALANGLVDEIIGTPVNITPPAKVKKERKPRASGVKPQSSERALDREVELGTGGSNS